MGGVHAPLARKSVPVTPSTTPAKGGKGAHDVIATATRAAAGPGAPAERCLCCKYSLKNFSDKDAKNMNLHDIALANLKWADASKTMLASDMDGVMKHVGYMIMKASADSYANNALQGYDNDIHRIAINKELRAFMGGNMDVSMEHFAAEKRVHHTSSRAGGHPTRHRPMRRKGPCEAWNSPAGCGKGAGFEDHHNCCHCWDPSHRSKDCRDRGSAAFKPARQ